MARRIWIIAKKAKLADKDKVDASLNGCSEIANGIPPALRDIISEGQLPYAYEEPVLPEPEPPRDLASEIDDLKLRLTVLEPKAV